jgi:hypothetical protein
MAPPSNLRRSRKGRACGADADGVDAGGAGGADVWFTLRARCLKVRQAAMPQFPSRR